MNDGLKQRVVGALVLVVLGVIFLPMILDFKGDRLIDSTTRIPPAPYIVPVELKVAKKPDNMQPPKSAETVYQLPEPGSPLPENTPVDNKPVESTKTELKTDSPRLLNDKGLPLSWVVQVISYVDRNRANQFVATLQATGLKAFVRIAKISGGNRYRVFVGPYVQKGKAKTVKKSIDKEYRVKSIVLKFEP